MLVQMRSWASKQPLLVATLAAVLCGVVIGLALRQLHLNKDSLAVLGEMARHTVTNRAHRSGSNMTISGCMPCDCHQFSKKECPAP